MGDREAMRALALEAGLEDGGFDGVVTSYGAFDDDELKGCVALKRVGDVFSVEWLAVKQEIRGRGAGRRLVYRVAEDARSLGAKEIWALARSPDFFLRIGFSLSSEEESPGPTYAGCAKCPQYRTTCRPHIVSMKL